MRLFFLLWLAEAAAAGSSSLDLDFDDDDSAGSPATAQFRNTSTCASSKMLFFSDTVESTNCKSACGARCPEFIPALDSGVYYPVQSQDHVQEPCTLAGGHPGHETLCIIHNRELKAETNDNLAKWLRQHSVHKSRSAYGDARTTAPAKSGDNGGGANADRDNGNLQGKQRRRTSLEVNDNALQTLSAKRDIVESAGANEAQVEVDEAAEKNPVKFWQALSLADRLALKQQFVAYAVTQGLLSAKSADSVADAGGGTLIVRCCYLIQNSGSRASVESVLSAEMKSSGSRRSCQTAGLAVAAALILSSSWW